MEGGVEDEFRRATEHFDLWLRQNLTACHFATELARTANRIAMFPSRDPQTARVDLAFDTAADANQIAILILPHIAGEAALIELLHRFARESTRWTIHRRAITTPRPSIALGIEWRTAASEVSEVMGFAPFPTMPVTRRAPYVAIGLWPGVHCNPCRAQRTAGRVSFINALPAPAHCKQEKFDTILSHTDRAVNELLAESEDISKHYRKVAFVVDQSLESLVSVD